ncbi:MAG TPA: alpha/beta hydrolase-fold protein [Thermomicrobiales bacterium]|nr:alpha/beta hydrolase-fold protein [Thermomicrobiales bacterium]
MITDRSRSGSGVDTCKRERRWPFRLLLGVTVLVLATGTLSAWGYSQGWDRYIHYRHLPDWNRSHEKALLATLGATATANSAAATPSPRTAMISPNASPAAASSPTVTSTPTVDMAGLSDGNVTSKSIDSPTLGKPFGYRIYLPPGYDDKRFATTHYPVIFLLHGAPGGKDDWIDGGLANQTADALIKTATIRPVIIVMPDGSLGDPHHDTQWGNSPVTGERVEDALVDDLIPAIDATYRTIPGPDTRAIAGLSSGGYGALNIALHHPDTFHVVVSLSGYFKAAQTYDGHDIWGSDQARAENSPANNVGSRDQPLHIELIDGLDEGQGVDDTKAFDAQLIDAKIDHQTLFFPGGHAWEFWKDHLLEALEYCDSHLAHHASAPGGFARGGSWPAATT